MAECKLFPLINKTGYPLVQNNGRNSEYKGQRMFGPPPDWTGPAPPKGCEVFVGKLPREILEDELVPLFSSLGKIYEMRLMMHFSGSNRGFGFVTYTNHTDAMAARRQLNNYEIRPGWHIKVVKSVDKCRLYVRGIPKEKTKKEVLEELSEKAEGVVDVILYKNCFDRKMNRGYAFVDFATHRAASIARRSLVRRLTKPWDVSVDWANPEPEVDDDKMSQVRVLYVRDFLLETTSEEIKGVFEQAIGHEIEGVKKFHDYAFVHFFERNHAEQAMMRLQNAVIDGAQIEISWAKPVDRELYKIQKIHKGNAKFNPIDPELPQLLLMYRQHVEKREYTLDFKVDERIGSECATESSRGSPTATVMTDFNERIYSAPTELDAMCKRYGWAMPQYTCNNFYNMGTEFWVCKLDLSHVGLPLLMPPHSVGPFLSRTCYSKELAQVDVAEAALKYLKALRIYIIQQTALQSRQTARPPMYQPTILSPMPNYGLPYEYLSPPLSSRPPPSMRLWRAD